jgi:hypothetical protein
MMGRFGHPCNPHGTISLVGSTPATWEHLP